MQPGNKLLLPLRSSQYLTPLSSPSLFSLLSHCATIATSRMHISILSLFFFHAVNFVLPFSVSLLPLSSPYSVDIWLLFGDLKLRVPPTPSVRLMFDKGPLKCADFRGCLADGLVGLQRVQAGGLPSERDQLLPRHCYPFYPLYPPLLLSSLALPRALGMRRSREGMGAAAEKVQVSSRARACGLGLFGTFFFGTR